MTDESDWSTPRKLSHAEARQEQRDYWSRKTIPERLAAMTALNKRLLSMRGIDIDELAADCTVSFVSRRKG